MPTNKGFKRLVRGRMQKTGESYTAARAQLLKRAKPNTASRVDYARLAGMMSDAALKAMTGCTWERWVHALDRVDAHTWPHRRIAQYVRTKYKTPDWWSQMVTVGYERIKGLRAIGQRRGGDTRRASRTGHRSRSGSWARAPRRVRSPCSIPNCRITRLRCVSNSSGPSASGHSRRY